MLSHLLNQPLISRLSQRAFGLHSLNKLFSRSVHPWVKLPLTSVTTRKLIPKVVGCAITVTSINLLRHYYRPSPVLLSAKCDAELKRADVYLDEIDDLDTEPSFDWKEFFLVLLPEFGLLFAAIVSAFVVAIVNIKIPIYLGEIVNVLSEFVHSTERNYTQAVQLPALHLVGVYAIQGLCTFAYITLLSALGERLAARLRKRVFDSVIFQDAEFFDVHRTGEIINRLTSDVQDFKSSFKLCISQGLRSITQIIGSVGALVLLSPTLTGAMGVLLPCMVGAGSILGSGLRILSKKAQDQNSKATAVADEAVGNIKTVKAFAMEDSERRLFAQEVDESCRLYQSLGVGIGIFQGLSNFALNGLVLGVLYTGGYFMSREQLKPGDLMSFLVATQTIQRSMAQLSLLFGSAVRGYAAGTRVFEYLSLVPKIERGTGVEDDYALRDACVHFNNVSFHYPCRPGQTVLDDFTLKVPRGKVVAICGKSGAGKSTIVALLERFYDPSSGEIIVSGRDLREYDVPWLRGRFLGLISQEPTLFHTTVRENIRYGRSNATDEEVEEAASLANADAFIREFPKGYDTVVGERGTSISGGQKQRIAIARALIKNPALLILDEATSALDAESERLVQDALEKVLKYRTVIVIAHRLSTIQNADLIVVLSRGRIVERGTHEDLVKMKGHYWNLIQRQREKENTGG